MQAKSRSCIFLMTLLCCTAIGCQSGEDPIVTYSVPKHEAIQIPVETPGGRAPSAGDEAPPSSQQSKGRMLAAFILDGNVSWSFKALASPEAFPESAAKDFEQLIQSLKFEDPQKPTWELGERWEERPGSGMRAANLLLDGLEFSVIKLPVRDGNQEKYVLDNINRWRGQLNLPPVSQDELASSVETVETQDGHSATMLDLTGMRSGTAMGPMAGRTTPPPTTPPTAESSRPFTDRAPEGWEATKAGMMQLATYLVESNGKSAKVSISRAGGAVLPNINRWRGQVGLSPVSDLSEASMEDLTVSGQATLLAEIHGTSGQSIIVAMLPADNPTWFFKLQGDSEAVKDNSASFRAYLATVKLTQ